MARGTLEALNWLEGLRDTAPSSHRRARPDDEAGEGGAWRPSALQREILQTEDWGSGHVQPPTEDMHFHGAVWALLRWWRFPSDTPGGSLAITVPGLGPDPRLRDR